MRLAWIVLATLGCGGSAEQPTDARDGVDSAAPGDDGTVGGFAGFDLEAHAVYSLDLAAGDYPTFLTEGATSELEPGTGWNGAAAVRVTPPLAGGYGALGGFPLWKDGSFEIRKLNFRFEVQLGPSFGTHWPNDDLKFVIVHTADTLGGETNERPMCNWANAGEEGAGLLAWAVGAGTVKNFNRTPPFEPAYAPGGNEDFYVAPVAGDRGAVPRVLGPEAWISVEVEVIADATDEAPLGRIRSVLTARDGALTTLEIPWTYDANWTLGRFISEVQVIGGYYNTGTTAAAPDNFYRIADHVTFAANRPGLLGPRRGFVTE